MFEMLKFSNMQISLRAVVLVVPVGVSGITGHSVAFVSHYVGKNA